MDQSFSMEYEIQDQNVLSNHKPGLPYWIPDLPKQSLYLLRTLRKYGSQCFDSTENTGQHVSANQIHSTWYGGHIEEHTEPNIIVFLITMNFHLPTIFFFVSIYHSIDDTSPEWMYRHTTWNNYTPTNFVVWGITKQQADQW